MVCFEPPSLLVGIVCVPAIHFLYVCSIHCKVFWRVGRGAKIVQTDFIATFDRDDHQGILYKLYSDGTGGSVLSILTLFLSNRPQHGMVNGCRSKLVNVVSGVLQCTGIGSVIVPPAQFGAVFHPGEYKHVGYADNSTQAFELL